VKLSFKIETLKTLKRVFFFFLNTFFFFGCMSHNTKGGDERFELMTFAS
jgi:hypothetical protein